MPNYVLLIAAGLLSAACAYGGHIFLDSCKVKDYKQAFWRKGFAGLCFIAVGLIMALIRGGGFSWLIVLGLVFGLGGDQLLALRFVYSEKHDLFFAAGALSFAVGHLLYIIALQRLFSGLLMTALVIFIVCIACSGAYAFIRKSNAGGLLQIFGGIYVGVVAFMSAMAVAALLRNPGLGSLLFALGGIMFLLSDNILAAYCFGNKKSWGMNRAVHITYYGAQILIAWSIYFI